MADFVYRPISPLPAERINPTADRLMPLGMRLAAKTGVDADHHSIEIEDATAALVADVNAMLQVAGSLDGIRYCSGQIESSLNEYSDLAQQLLSEIVEDDEQTSLSGIRRSAIEHYPFFCDGQKLAQRTGLAGWDIGATDDSESS